MLGFFNAFCHYAVLFHVNQNTQENSSNKKILPLKWIQGVFMWRRAETEWVEGPVN